MSNTRDINLTLAELNKKREELQAVLNGYKASTARISKSMHDLLAIFLDKIQTVVEMAYRKNSNFQTLEKISNEILAEITKLILLKGELWNLSHMETGDRQSFPHISTAVDADNEPAEGIAGIDLKAKTEV